MKYWPKIVCKRNISTEIIVISQYSRYILKAGRLLILLFDEQNLCLNIKIFFTKTVVSCDIFVLFVKTIKKWPKTYLKYFISLIDIKYIKISDLLRSLIPIVRFFNLCIIFARKPNLYRSCYNHKCVFCGCHFILQCIRTPIYLYPS